MQFNFGAIENGARRVFNIAQWLLLERLGVLGVKDEPHFVREYRRVVTKQLARLPLKEAMSAAVGGQYERVGDIELAVLQYAGLRDGMSLIDFGCGSGRLASALAKAALHIHYLGVDVEPRLLNYAKRGAPADFKFVLNRALTIPSPDASADFICAFSVFTHLRHAETYLYLRDMHRVLRPGGRLVFSFIEFAQPLHWKIFEEDVEAESRRVSLHLNQFVERNVLNLWCEKLGYEQSCLIESDAAPGGGSSLGQTAMILRRQ
jgi:SAM-dependent methyltransferase